MNDTLLVFLLIVSFKSLDFSGTMPLLRNMEAERTPHALCLIGQCIGEYL